MSRRLNQRASSSSAWSTSTWRTGDGSQVGRPSGLSSGTRDTHLGVGGANPGVAAQHEGAVGEGPVLRGAVGDGVDLQTHLLRHLPAHRLLQGLTWNRRTRSGSRVHLDQGEEQETSTDPVHRTRPGRCTSLEGRRAGGPAGTGSRQTPGRWPPGTTRTGQVFRGPQRSRWVTRVTWG